MRTKTLDTVAPCCLHETPHQLQPRCKWDVAQSAFARKNPCSHRRLRQSELQTPGANWPGTGIRLKFQQPYKGSPNTRWVQFPDPFCGCAILGACQKENLPKLLEASQNHTPVPREPRRSRPNLLATSTHVARVKAPCGLSLFLCAPSGRIGLQFQNIPSTSRTFSNLLGNQTPLAVNINFPTSQLLHFYTSQLLHFP